MSAAAQIHDGDVDVPVEKRGEFNLLFIKQQ
jgi:hypothetical protein